MISDDTDVYQALGFRPGVFLILSSFSARISWNLMESPPRTEGWVMARLGRRPTRRDETSRSDRVCRLTGSTSWGHLRTRVYQAGGSVQWYPPSSNIWQAMASWEIHGNPLGERKETNKKHRSKIRWFSLIFHCHLYDHQRPCHESQEAIDLMRRS